MSIISQGDWYHRNCFRCVDCNRLLDSLTNCDGPDGQLYCKKCYCVKYGPQTRSSDVDHKLIDLSTIKIEEGQPGKNCPRYSRANFDGNIYSPKNKMTPIKILYNIIISSLQMWWGSIR